MTMPCVCKTFLSSIVTAIILISVSGQAVADPEIWSNPSWPSQCGSTEKGDQYLVTKYLRFYPTKEQAKLQTPQDGNNLIFGLRAAERMQVAYVTSLENDGTPKSIIAPYWIPTDQVDLINFKLRQVHPKLWRYFRHGDPSTIGPIGKGIFAGADNYRCITEIGPTDGFYTLVHVQGYIYRPNDYSTYFSLLP